eukprot:scaffold23647_cov60-Phaeocystis_antarctica.AAC.2
MPSIDPVSDCDPVLHAARSRVLLDEPLVVGETRQNHTSGAWWQILRLPWRWCRSVGQRVLHAGCSTSPD